MKQCGPFVVAFNRKFSRIEIHSDKTEHIREIKREELRKRLWQITVARSETGKTDNFQEYLVMEGQKSSISVPPKSVAETPRLFLGFPLIGTEEFSFPAIINSFEFTPTEERDSVLLGKDNEKEIQENKSVISEACGLLVDLFQFEGSSCWNGAYTLATIPPISGQKELDLDWFRECLQKQLIEQIRQTPAVLCEHGARTSPKDSILPFAEEDIRVEALWDLLDGLKEFRQKLPRRYEAVGWCNAVKSWADVCGTKASFEEAIDGRKLAERVEIDGGDKNELKNLQNLLLKNAVEWLDCLYKFLKNSRLFDERIRRLFIFPSQDGYLRELSALHRDKGVAEELKDIAELLDWNIRSKLRDERLDSLTDEKVSEDWDSDYIVRELVAKLRERAEEEPDSNFARASVCLFKWIVDQNDWDRLRDFPVFAKQDGSDDRTVFRLKRNGEDDEQHLAPVGAWPGDLQPFSDLFPRSYILADDFFKAVSNPDAWQTLETQGFIRTNVIITKDVKDVNFDKFLPDEPLSDDKEHQTVASVTTTDIVFLQKERVGIMERVRNSRSRARLFWHFLTEWLVEKDMPGIEKKETDCKCGDTHHYFQAAWLVPLAKNVWVPLGDNKRDRATAKSLASLLRGSGWKPSSLTENSDAVKLLEAIGVTRLDLLRAFGATSEEKRRAQDDVLAEILVATDGNIEHLSDLVGDLQDDAEELFNDLKERREQKRMVRENQRLGTLVEKLVEKSLEDKGFTVERTGTGSDYKIESPQGGQSWLVEVKATRGHEVRDMTDTQAKTAVKEGSRFLLCVVQVEPGSEPQLDTVRANMRFVENIGSRVADLCDNLEKFKNLHSNMTTVESSPGIRLEVKVGPPRICVAKSVWDKGFCLEDLSKKLKW